MKTIILTLLLVFITSACSVLPEEDIPGSNLHLASLGQAPKLTNTTWINTERSLRLADLRGQVLLMIGGHLVELTAKTPFPRWGNRMRHAESTVWL